MYSKRKMSLLKIVGLSKIYAFWSLLFLQQGSYGVLSILLAKIVISKVKMIKLEMKSLTQMF
jgi:hypothetical protein